MGYLRSNGNGNGRGDGKGNSNGNGNNNGKGGGNNNGKGRGNGNRGGDRGSGGLPLEMATKGQRERQQQKGCGGGTGMYRGGLHTFMQDTKDTFYVMLRDRVAAGNPGRTAVVRGVTRPGVLVEENELPTTGVPPDVFLVSWTGMRVDRAGVSPLVALTCSIRYGTDGNASSVGMDRGRLLAGMDAELGTALGAGVGARSVRKVSYAGIEAGSTVTLKTNVFWGDVTFGPAVAVGERLERVAVLEVFGFVEAGG